MAAAFLIFTLQCLLPIFDIGAGEYLGISIVNTDNQSREYTITATPTTGVSPQTGRLTLSARAQRAFFLNEILGTAPQASGWIRIDSAASGCATYLASGNDEVLAGTDAAAASSPAIVLPHIAVNTGFVELGHTDTTILIANAGAAAANVTAQLVGLDAAVIGTSAMTIAANGSRTGRISELFRDVLPDNTLGGKRFDGYLLLSANVPISAWQRIDTPLSRNMLRGKSIPSELTSAVIPHFVLGSGNFFDTIVNLVNPGSTSSQFELAAVNDSGQSLADPVQITLGAGEAKRMRVGELFQIAMILIYPPPLISGHIYIRPLPVASPAMQQLIATVEVDAHTDIGLTASLLYSVHSAGSTEWTIPFAATSRHFTGYVVANANEFLTVQNAVQVEILSSAGDVLTRIPMSLSPGRRHSEMLPLFPPGSAGGYLRFTSTMPVHVIGAIGTRDLRVLDQIPAIPQ